MKDIGRRERTIRPIHPGEMLREDYLPSYGISVQELAEHIGVTRQTIYELLREERACTPEMALRLARAFDTSAEFWLNAQRSVDLWEAANVMREVLRSIRPLVAPTMHTEDR